MHCGAIYKAAARESHMDVEVVPATRADQPVLRHLLQLHLHDFSEILGTMPSADGLFSYPYLEHYWADSARRPFLLKADNQLAGFALVRTGSLLTGAPGVSDMTEFFVLRGLRRRGVGRAAANALFKRLPGTWEVRVVEHYASALAFWYATITAAERLTWSNDGGLRFTVFRFKI